MLQRAVFGLVVLSLACRAAASMEVRVVPEAPTNLTPVTIEIWGEAGDPSQWPSPPVVTISGTDIRIALRAYGGSRISVAVPFEATVQLGPLAPGDHSLDVVHFDAAGETWGRYTAVLSVRDVTTIPIVDPLLRSGSHTLTVASPPYLESATEVRIGGMAVRLTGPAPTYSSTLEVQGTLPPGLHDLSVRWRDGRHVVARNAVQMDSPEGDATFGERFLVPVFYSGSDSSGAWWETNLIGSAAVGQRPAGVWLYVPPHRARHFLPRLQVRRVTSDGKSSRWERLPIVRENEFKLRATLPEVPFGPNRDVRVRVYGFDARPVSVTNCGSCGTLQEVRLQRYRADEPAFGTLAYPRSSMEETRSIHVGDRDGLVWAFATSTDLVTGEVTIVTPSTTGVVIAD